MKIAILFTGHHRAYQNYIENCRSALKEFKNDEIDYFLTTWYEEGVNYNIPFFKAVDIEMQSIYTNQVYKIQEYNERFLNYNNASVFYKMWPEPEDHKRFHVPFLYYKLNRGLDMIQKYSYLNNVHYDAIIKLRIDTSLQNIITREQIKNLQDGIYLKKININNANKYININTEYLNYTNEWVDDCFFFFKSNLIEVIKNIHFKYFELCDKHNTWISHVIYNKFFEENNIKVHDHDINMYIHRKDGTFFQPVFYACIENENIS